VICPLLRDGVWLRYVDLGFPRWQLDDEGRRVKIVDSETFTYSIPKRREGGA
jgi:hypothetical protein